MIFSEYLPRLSATSSARFTALILFSLFVLSLRHFSFDHFDKISLQMQTTLISENTITIEPSLIYRNDEGGGEFYEFDDDGEEDVELYNDEEFY